MSSPFEIKIKDERFNLKEGIEEVPEFLAVYLVGSRKAKII